MVIKRIISGAQTGADRAALDAALALGLPIGGWVPRGRRAEDGPVPDRYPNLHETDTDDYETRTRLNVQDADATLILSHGPLSGGSKLTQDIAGSLGKAVRHVDLGVTSIDNAVSETRAWLATVEGETLNVAGPRASNDGEIYEKTREVITQLIGDDMGRP
jgi:hypothetical protein